MKMNLNLFIFGMMLVVLLCGIYKSYNFLFIDCEKNPPQPLSCDSTNLIDMGLKDCVQIKSEKWHLFSSNEPVTYSCLDSKGNRIETEYSQTNCHYAESNLTSDYRWCR